MIPREQFQLAAFAEGKAADAVELRLEDPARIGELFADEGRQHGITPIRLGTPPDLLSRLWRQNVEDILHVGYATFRVRVCLRTRVPISWIDRSVKTEFGSSSVMFLPASASESFILMRSHRAGFDPIRVNA